MRVTLLFPALCALASHTLAAALPEPQPMVNGPPAVFNDEGLYASEPEVADVSMIHARNAVPAVDKREQACDNFTATILQNHNVHRVNHSAPYLTWNQTAANHALEWANKCIWAHNTSYGEGQNLAAGYQYTRDAISNGWYNGEMPSFSSFYGQASPDMSKFGSFGHFTQVVWAGTKSVGCASVKCSNIAGIPNAYYTVCNYYPPGNYLGQFGQNVGKPRGLAVVGGICANK